ncbi:pyridoxamine 5'-phosphate oxidase family protein [Sulfuricurvum sp.]|uniref:pyridoxamine 5'-phosphate oxidase family protein n=1 Tax=Sulfuricurvum sp. TaxID=2025608 RepID=UPI00260C6C48|nr:pyridoxamine 5'-phosphate oxidase family protein [Sulfuricurvum sp.]MDD4950264.1 pyridoxamine 5'-phosphate oxidase family protein [Sulfuricurvum sp.]
MGSQSGSLNEYDKEFITEQKIFFIASCSGKEVNLSPRGYDCFRVSGDNEALFLDYAGSGNRTARDIENDGEVTVVFCSFGPKPQILRLFCKGESIDRSDEACRNLFPSDDLRGIRRFVKLHIYCVEHSCGMSVPMYEFKEERKTIKAWCARDADNGKVDEYIADHAIPVDLSGFRHW